MTAYYMPYKPLTSTDHNVVCSSQYFSHLRLPGSCQQSYETRITHNSGVNPLVVI
ncbi:hypothetical protein DL89DRAFT_25374 [Linderina pennispora]|uniref:Uncharacterized protein n=1 Tax=Linderina pennispora TaxID=61395 RepID=A0A1Y1WN40_9FUNG|nr:uncharacterized protein DL89DRAFT_25374 [Linderina pennispora]ORX74971.1 hypothetical protein DL89DRAFT_25374 [Linderina pennispora]